MQCDICGKETRVFLTEVEGAKLYVCSVCNPSGTGRISRPKFNNERNFKKFVPRVPTMKEDPFDLTNYDLVDNYLEKLKEIRESKKMTIEEFAKFLFVPDSYLQKVEQGKLKPSSSLLLKIYEKCSILLINKMPEINKPKLFRKHKPFENRPRFENKRKFDKEENKDEPKYLGPKTIYQAESNEDMSKTVDHNNKKKIIL